MTDEQVTRKIEIIKSATKEASRTKETAIKFLRDAGILKDEAPKRSKKKK